MVLWSASAPVPVDLPAKPLDGAAAGTSVTGTPVLVESDQPLDKALDSLRG
jgi:hypothetical protein